ncbi:MAG: cadherin repeat domain-containing protein [Cytophagales bacterium]|nr:cadherin repeat domain-containing protein [Cytophagales bacterium]
MKRIYSIGIMLLLSLGIKMQMYSQCRPTLFNNGSTFIAIVRTAMNESVYSLGPQSRVGLDLYQNGLFLAPYRRSLFARRMNGNTLEVHVQSNESGSHTIAIWLDMNENNTFESSERIALDQSFMISGSQNGFFGSYRYSIPNYSCELPVEKILRLRIGVYRGIQNPNPCSMQEFWGEVEDHSLIIPSNISNTPTSAHRSLSLVSGNNQIGLVNFGGQSLSRFGGILITEFPVRGNLIVYSTAMVNHSPSTISILQGVENGVMVRSDYISDSNIGSDIVPRNSFFSNNFSYRTTNPSLSDRFRFRVRDCAGLLSNEVYDYILNAYEPPTISFNSTGVDENSPASTFAGSINVDANPNNETLLYSITSGNTDNLFRIDGNGNIYTTQNNSLDFELRNNFTLEINVRGNDRNTNANLSSQNVEANIDILNVNEPPDPGPTTFVYDYSNAIIGNVIATLNPSDPEGENITFYVIEDDAHGSLSLNQNTGEFIVDSTRPDTLSRQDRTTFLIELRDAGGVSLREEYRIDFSFPRWDGDGNYHLNPENWSTNRIPESLLDWISIRGSIIVTQNISIARTIFLDDAYIEAQAGANYAFDVYDSYNSYGIQSSDERGYLVANGGTITIRDEIMINGFNRKLSCRNNGTLTLTDGKIYIVRRSGQ